MNGIALVNQRSKRFILRLIMLILPLHRKPSRESLPLVTVLLVMANALVFAFFQSSDDQVEEQAAERYLASGVLEHEWDWFLDWADTTSATGIDARSLHQALPEVGERRHADFIRLITIESEPEFQQAVRDEWFVPAESAAYRQWEAARAQLAEDRQESFTRRNMLGYDKVEASTMLTHMFMHGSVMHLIGNMMFLVLLGILLEPALGAFRFLLGYIASGFGAAGVSLVVHWGEGGGMVGASGAIAGLMGLLTLVYGMRRIRFFYWAFVYFDYVRAPALLLLPLWLGWELFALIVYEGSNVAYEAHIGGIVCGAAIGALLVRTNQVNSHWLESATGDERLEGDQTSVRQAQAALDELNAAQAKRLLKPLLSRHGEELQLLNLYLAACQLRSGDPDLHDAARRILELPGDSSAQRQLVADTFKRYLDATGGRMRLRADLALGLSGRFIQWQRFEEARALIDRMARLNRPIPDLPAHCRGLADGLQRSGSNPQLADHYRRLADSLAQST